MTRPPAIMRLRVSDNRRPVSLWIPLFVIFPLVFVFFLILLPFILISALILGRFGWGKSIIMLGPALIDCICNLRDFEVRVENPRENILMSFK